MSFSPSAPPVALTIAGSDSSAGAGIQADLKTFAALGVYGVNAVSAIVAEAPGAVSSVFATESTLLSTQIQRVSKSFPVSAVKTGMLATASNVREVVRFLRENPKIPAVVDPVIRASAGTELLSSGGVELMKSDLLPRVTLVTPNLPESEELLGETCDPESAARKIADRFGCDALVKGGHDASGSKTIVDFACIGGELFEFPHPRLDVPDLHGTGCTLSAAITARLAFGDSTLAAVSTGIDYLTKAMMHHFDWPEPAVTTALNHFPDGVGSERS